jgi:phenylacetate-coenzyme A ligase PaaK-like adenylate-forming protein
MTLLASLREMQLAPRLSAYAALYQADAAPDFVAARQLLLLNAAWASSLARSPWARTLQERFALPSQFESLEAFDAVVPIMGKRELRAALEAVPGNARGIHVSWRATGGSTGEPFRFPTWAEEHACAALDIWLGRRRLGIAPSDRLFLLWGHAHLLGAGWRGALNSFRRRLSDHLLGYVRCSAYELADADLARTCDMLLSVRPDYVVGYASALDRFARASRARSRNIASLNLKAVIATAEGFPHADSRNIIARCFGAPVLSEYGTVETGPLAYEDASGVHNVFWAHYRLTTRGGAGPEASEAVVTSLYPRALPLLRYALGDLVDAEPAVASAAGLRRIRRVVGRCNDVVPLPNGAAIHSEAFTHCMRDLPGVRAFQVVVARQGWPRLRYEAEGELDAGSISEVRRRLAIVDPSLADTPVERTERVVTSIAGKHKTVVVE